LNSPVGVFTMHHQYGIVPLVELESQPRKIPLQFPTAERDILNPSLQS
ncbi:MAG: hypothetical protein EZS28_039312, partial [Streblomastix strix]